MLMPDHGDESSLFQHRIQLLAIFIHLTTDPLISLELHCRRICHFTFHCNIGPHSALSTKYNSGVIAITDFVNDHRTLCANSFSWTSAAHNDESFFRTLVCLRWSTLHIKHPRGDQRRPTLYAMHSSTK